MAEEEIVKLVLSLEAQGGDKIVKQFKKQWAEVEDYISTRMVDAMDVEKALSASIRSSMKKSGKDIEKELKKSFDVSNILEKSLNVGFAGLKAPKEAGQQLAKGLFEGFGDAGKELSKRMAASSKKTLMSKESSKSAKVMATILGKLGPAVKLLSVVVGSMAQMVALLIDAEAQAKDLNRAILDGGVAGGDLGASFGQVAGKLEELRDAALDVSNNMRWGTTAKEQLEIIAAYNEAGFTLREMAASMKSYQDVTRVALTYSKLLGMSTKEIASMQATYLEEIGGGLDFIESQFAAVHRAAQLSGFGVKRFTGMIQQATSGMAMYNVRIDETAGLLLQLGKSFSPKDAEKLMNSLTQGFKSESYQESFKRAAQAGVKVNREVMNPEAERQARSLTESLSEKGMKAFEEGLGFAPGELDLEKDMNEVVRRMSNLSNNAVEDLAYGVKLAGDKAMGGKISGLALLSSGAKGGLSSQAMARPELGAGATLAMKARELEGVMGKSVSDFESIQEFMAHEAMTGVGREEGRLLYTFSRDMEGAFRNITKEISSYEGMSDEEVAKAQAEQLRNLGIAVDRNGQRFVAALDENGNLIEDSRVDVNSVTEFMTNSDALVGDMTSAALDRNTALAQEIAKNTTEVSKLLEIGVAYYMEKIYKILYPLASKILGGRDPKEVQAELDATSNIAKEVQDQRVDLEKNLTELRAKLSSTDDEAEKAGINKQIAQVEEGLKQNAVRGEMVNLRRASVESSLLDPSMLRDLEDPDQVLKSIDAVYGEEGVKKLEASIAERIETLEGELGRTLSKDEKELLRDSAISKVGENLRYGEGLDFSAVAENTALSTSVAKHTLANPEASKKRQGTPIEDQGFMAQADKFLELWGKDMNANPGKYGAAVATATTPLLGVADWATGGAVSETGGDMINMAADLLGGKSGGMLDAIRKAVPSEKKMALMEEALKSGNKTAEEHKVVGEDLLNMFSDGKVADSMATAIADGNLAKNFADEFVKKQLRQKALSSLGSDYTPEQMAEAMLTADLAAAGSVDALHRLGGSEAQDFIYRPGSPPMKFSDQDTVVGFKKGGAFDNSSGKPNVNINVYGSQGEIVATIKRVLNQFGWGT